MVVLVLLGCADVPAAAEGTLSGGRWTHDGLGVALSLPAEGRWTRAPEDFASGLDAVLLEGRLGNVNLAVTGHRAGPWLAAELSGGGALDALLRLAPAATDPDAPVRRLEACDGAVVQSLDGMDRLALAPRAGSVAVVYAWGADPTARLAALVRLACPS